MALYTLLSKETIHQIGDEYGLQVKSFQPFDGGNSNTSYLLSTNLGDFVLTLFEEKAEADIEKLGRLLTLLEEHGFPSTPVLKSKTGSVVTSYDAKPLMVKRYVEGEVLENLSITMLADIGNALARLQQIPENGFLNNEHPYGLQLFSSVLKQHIDPAYESWLAEKLDYLERSLPPELPVGLIHGDLFFDNVLIEHGKFKAIIDLGEACVYYKAFDVAMGIIGLCSYDTATDFRKVKAFVDGYQQVRLFEQIEQEILQLLVEYAAIATSYWRFWKYNIHTPFEERANKHWQMVRLSEEIAAIPSARFIEQVF